MGYVSAHRKELDRRNYVREASTADHWFDFSAKKLGSYQARFGENFCLILFSASSPEEAYVFPYKAVKHLLKEEILDHRGRWIGSITDGHLHIRHVEVSLNVAPYLNAFELVQDASESAG